MLAIRRMICFLVVVWALPAFGVVTEPENLPAVKWEPLDQKATRVSYSDVIVYRDLMNGKFWALYPGDASGREIIVRLTPLGGIL